MQPSRQIIAEIQSAIEAQDSSWLCRALSKTPTPQAPQDLRETVLVGATALVNWDACALDVIPHPGLHPTPDGQDLDKWLGDYLRLRQSISEEAIAAYTDGDCNALMLRGRISDLIRNLFFEFPLESA